MSKKYLSCLEPQAYVNVSQKGGETRCPHYQVGSCEGEGIISWETLQCSFVCFRCSAERQVGCGGGDVHGGRQLSAGTRDGCYRSLHHRGEQQRHWGIQGPGRGLGLSERSL